MARHRKACWRGLTVSLNVALNYSRTWGYCRIFPPRDIGTFKRLAQLYAAVRNAYADKIGFVADLAYKTRQLVEQNAMQDGLGRLTKNVTFDVKTLEALRWDKGSDEGKVFNLVRGLQKEIDDDPNAAPVLQPLKDRTERILKDLENRNTTGLAAMDLLAALAAEVGAEGRRRFGGGRHFFNGGST